MPMLFIFYRAIRRACDRVCRVLHLIERPFQRLQCWAWLKMTEHSLRGIKADIARLDID